MHESGVTNSAACGTEELPHVPRISNRLTKLLYVVAADWYFYTHRRQLALAAQRSGYEILLATQLGQYCERLTRDGISVFPIRLQRRGMNPAREMAAIFELISIYRRARPDIVHHVGLKPVIYGTFAALLTGVPAVVNAMGGLGYIFASRQLLARAFRGPVRMLLRLVLNRERVRVVLQTAHDRDVLVRLGIRKCAIVVIRSAGVDLAEFRPAPELHEPLVVLLACRLLWDKGVGDFVQAARLLRAKGLSARFVLVGGPDPENPSSIPHVQIECWQKDGDVEWWGRKDEMPAVFAQSHVVCLPTTYGEGVPKVLLEAAACERPIIATDLPGCREIVRHGENGLIVPARSPEALAEAIRVLLESPDVRQRMGRKGRQIVEAEFSVERVAAETLAVYQELLS